ncbi:MAG: hypothetical protein K0A90_00080 [Methanosarcinaceae archaeon]|nr:hypothetical protein [Methanosarcinaceae archaeon]
MDGIEKNNITISVAALITVIFFIMAQTYALTTWKAEIENSQKSLEHRYTKMSEAHTDFMNKIEDLNKRQAETDIGRAKIETQLTNIQTLLIEIKTDLKKL